MNKIDPSRKEQLDSWWANYLYPEFCTEPGEVVESLTDYAISHIGDIRFVSKAIELVEDQLHKCKARSEAQFQQWCRHQIDKLQNKRAGTKEFLYEQHGDNIFIPLYSADELHVWTIPADWLDSARMIWPVHLCKFSNGRFYVSKKVAVDGRQRNVAVHRLFMGLSPVRHEVTDNLEVYARNDNWLDFTNDNLYLASGADALNYAISNWEVIEYDDPLSALDPRRVWRTPSNQEEFQENIALAVQN